jgi:hypothetical protein
VKGRGDTDGCEGLRSLSRTAKHTGLWGTAAGLSRAYDRLTVCGSHAGATVSVGLWVGAICMPDTDVPCKRTFLHVHTRLHSVTQAFDMP